MNVGPRLLLAELELPLGTSRVQDVRPVIDRNRGGTVREIVVRKPAKGPVGPFLKDVWPLGLLDHVSGLRRRAQGPHPYLHSEQAVGGRHRLLDWSG